MSAHEPAADPQVVIYYHDDADRPLADHTDQFAWIGLLLSAAATQFRSDPMVFVAGNHLIYPVEGNAKLRQAPDVYVAFGPRKGDRGSYRVWEEGGVFPQVVFEVWSPNNRHQRMEDKRAFYERYGAEEYYIVYPDFPLHAEGWRREGGALARIPDMNGWVSPRLGWRFALDDGELTVFWPDGRPLPTPAEVAAARDAAEQRAAKLAAKLRELGLDPDAV
ncbi:MAG: Uma2 family endonuclease [Gemmataceae bacterium]|nr:Uma2 family endonuclease [Gemmataceae bacterium]